MKAWLLTEPGSLDHLKWGDIGMIGQFLTYLLWPLN